MTWLDLGCGGGGSSLGVKNATSSEVIGIDIDPRQIEIYRANIGEGIVADYSRINPAQFLGIEGLHISFPCQGHSNIRSKKLPEREDKELGLKCLKWLDLKPRIFTSENVRGFKKSLTYNALINKLNQLGYWWQDGIIDMADYGVPQNRVRWVLWATLNEFAPVIQPWCESKVSWFEAIQDLIPDLPESTLTPQQIASINKKLPRLMAGQNLFGHEKFTTKGALEPGFCLTASIHKAMPKLIVERQGSGAWRDNMARLDCQPVWTITCSNCSRPTAINVVDGLEIKRLSIKAIARLQSFPDSYLWSGKTAVDGHSIGNAVPPRFMEFLIRSLTQCKPTISKTNSGLAKRAS
ncbi:DNA cytosine methyltransferase [Kamptonema sp. UHCC 0994]|uniref:DNA cytosine methyltransferase n=1 Tax=Kamptonema sp. UHCC 0994 TaxID=3031329 RepID=UPI0023B90AB2|nr:DNA cytosine methyltransferase [Kamptonema sp. UHCC 0994]MDF0554899.1 DNA cytosine methyltransferase [Kamptonema sp. UHCC 0994]